MYGCRNDFFSALFRIFTAIAVVYSFSGVCLAVQGGAGGSTYNTLTTPMTSNTMNTPLTQPVSSYQTYNTPIQTQALPNTNTIVTGNVGGLQYFHGSVPYSSPLGFRSTLESTSLDTFLRASTPSGQQFYSRTGNPRGSAVPGVAGFLSAPSEKVTTGVPTSPQDYFIPLSQLAAGVQPQGPTDLQFANPNVSAAHYNAIMNNLQGYRGVDQFVQQTEGDVQITQSDVDILTAEQQNSTFLQYEIESSTLEPFNQQMQRDQGQNNAFDQNRTRESVREPETRRIPDLTTERTDELMNLRAQGNEKIQQEIEEQWRQKIDVAQVGLPDRLRTSDTQIGSQTRQDIEEQWRQSLAFEQLDLRDRLDTSDTQARMQTREERRTRIAEISKAAPEQAEGPARTYVDFQKEFGDKFDHFIKAARQYLGEGKFYQAADAYSMASVYRQFDPNAYVGKAIALFAAGEYLSSSRVLVNGLRLDEDSVKRKIDLEEMLNNEMLLKSRILDLQGWANVSDSDELVFLFSYINYQTGKYIVAENAVNFALLKKPASKVYLELQKAIEKARAM